MKFTCDIIGKTLNLIIGKTLNLIIGKTLTLIFLTIDF